MSYRDEEVRGDHARQALIRLKIPGVSPKTRGHSAAVTSVTLVTEGGRGYVAHGDRKMYDESEVRYNRQTGKLEECSTS